MDLATIFSKKKESAQSGVERAGQCHLEQFEVVTWVGQAGFHAGRNDKGVALFQGERLPPLALED